MKYLIVEDDFSDVNLLRFRLQRIGFEVTIVQPWDALDVNRENMPEIVQLDGLGGKCFELYRQMKKDNLDAKYVLFTASGELIPAAYTTTGMTAVFDKSRGGSDLVEYIAQFLKK